MKYTHQVLYGGKLYKAGEEVPEGSLPDETSYSDVVKEEPVTSVEKKPAKKRATKKQ